MFVFGRRSVLDPVSSDLLCVGKVYFLPIPLFLLRIIGVSMSGPRDAMHPRYYSHGPVFVCLCPSVTSRCSIETAGRIELVFGV